MSPLMGRPALEGNALVGRSLVLLLAILLASGPLSILLAGSSWFLLTLTAATPVVIGGLVLRQLVDRQMLVPLLQLALVAVLVLVVETAQGLLTIGDGPLAMLTQQSVIFPGALSELASGMAPLTLGSRGTVLVVALLALGALVLDLVFVDLGWHTPTGLALMGTILIPALQQPSGGPWWTVVGPLAAGLMILATRTVHADPVYIAGDRRPQAGPLPRPLRTAGGAVASLLLVAVLAMPLGLVLPQLAPTQVALDMDVINRWQNRDMPQLGPVMIDDDVSVRRSLLQQDDIEVLRYTTSATKPSYLRLRTLNTFDGETYRNDTAGEDLALGEASFSDARDDGDAVDPSSGNLIRTEFSVESLGGDRLPVPDNIRGIDTTVPRISRALALQPSNGAIAVGRTNVPLTGLDYTILSEQNPATADELRRVDPAVFEQPFEAGYTSREEVPQVAEELAVQVAEDAGAENAFDTAVAYQEYFRSSFAYSLTVNSPPGEDPLESFLSDRIGYCEQFASTFALMMTAQGYPTRVAIGFTPGDQQGAGWSVSSNNAHAWPEVWFGPEHGWVRFEPTPAAAANGVSAPGVTQEDGGAEAEQSPDAPSEEPTEEETSPESTSEESTTEEGPTGADTTDAGTSDGGGLATDPQTVERVESGLYGGLAIGVLIAAAGAAAVLLLRRHRVHLREQRWNALVDDGDSGRVGGAAGWADEGAGGSGDSGGSGGAGAIMAERDRRRAGELAWSELTGELTVRARVIRVLGWTGAWGTPPQHLALDDTLPPARALEDLLDQIAGGELDVTPEHRATAARISSAYTAALYAAPLPGVGEPGAGAPSDHDRERQSEQFDAAMTAQTSVSMKAVPPLRADADQLIALIRNSR
ncbi:MAG: DUF3488 and transglutaminase-like domain-containing protein [Brachybacterium sp.]|uniref:DUF3488 and transglutaminase-like domain-containing protein n=1 Tax=Brachybacterium sp. TaxID=1891286 RepID=UPI0026488495|nr:DUF3488 and transglutaminase-like domain-containing protein [Brachybacterium sp.]MDN5685916.1 DUF3488 and transglutaminase-like domain-containing protein [Brachybacterium sp.]